LSSFLSLSPGEYPHGTTRWSVEQGGTLILLLSAGSTLIWRWLSRSLSGYCHIELDNQGWTSGDSQEQIMYKKNFLKFIFEKVALARTRFFNSSMQIKCIFRCSKFKTNKWKNWKKNVFFLYFMERKKLLLLLSN
jgi:hypothetical protein